VWDADTGKETKTHASHSAEVRSVSFFPDGATFASTGKDGNIRFYDLDHGDMWTLDNVHPNSIEGIAHIAELGQSRGGDQIAHGFLTAGADHTTQFWQYIRSKPGKLDAQQIPISFRFHSQPLTSIIFGAGDRKSIATGSWDGTIKLFDFEGGERFTFTGHKGAVRAMLMARDNSFLASASNDGTIRIWRADSPRAPARKQPGN
jgi:WD40 repeat protein